MFLHVPLHDALEARPPTRGGLSAGKCGIPARKNAAKTTAPGGENREHEDCEFVCRKCGDVVPAYYLVGRVCYSCHLDGYIPAGYQKAEQYRWDPVWGHLNATKRPFLGVSFLDESGPRIDLQMSLACRRKARPRWGAVSQSG